MSQDLRLTPKFRDTYAFLLFGEIEETAFTGIGSDIYQLLDPETREMMKNQKKDSTVEFLIKHGLMPVSDQLAKNGAKANAALILQLIKEIINLTNLEFTAMLAGNVARLTSYDTPETFFGEIQRWANSVISLEQYFRQELLKRGILQAAMNGVPSKSMSLDIYTQVFELGLLRIILMLSDTFLEYSFSSKQKKQYKQGDMVSISLSLKGSQEGDIPGLASEEIRKKGWNGIVQEYKVVKEGKKGFLGMGAEPNTYQIVLKVFPMRVLPEMVDPKAEMDKTQINEYVNDLVKSMIWSEEFLKTGFLPNPTELIINPS